MASIFISHAHSDWRLAKRLQQLLETTSRNGFDVAVSSEQGQIKSGENWRDWIDDKVLNCDVAIVLLTPASFRGRWVLWEAGAVTGVQYERLRGEDVTSDNPLARRVRVLHFGVDTNELGPFSTEQVRDGSNQSDLVSFISEMLSEFRETLDQDAVTKGLLGLEKLAGAFVEGARQDLRYTPIEASESVINEWLARLGEQYQSRNYRWVVASKRWINVAFLGAGNADAHAKGVPVDFRIHVRIADAYRRLHEWAGVIEQMELARSLSPNDLVILRQLGRGYRETGDLAALEKTMNQMLELDPEIFHKDREGVALRCGYFADMQRWDAVHELLSNADQSLVSTDAYLANWQAIASMKTKGAEASKLLFQQLKNLLEKTGKGFWDGATLVNALLALDKKDAATEILNSLRLPDRSADELQSASRYYDEIVAAFQIDFDWRGAAGLS
jgi:tetratricopeptide (TPR) repeat protein